MKRKRLLLLLCITILTLSACGKEKTPVISNNVETEVFEDTTTEPESIEDSKEAVTTEEVVESTTEIVEDSNIEVDINGVDGTVDEDDYDEELHGEEEKQPPASGTDEYQQMLEEMAKEIYNSNGGGNNYIPADPEAEAALGVTHGTTESTDPDNVMDYSTDPDLIGGSLE